MIESVGKKRYILWGLAAAGLSMMALLICFLALRVYPFGDHSVLTNDGYVQYVDYFRYLKKVMSGNAEIGYSFSKSLGGSLIALFGYYLASPLNLLLYVIPIEKIEFFVFAITVLKVGLCGFTFSLFIRHRLENLRPAFALILSLAYAFTQYNVGQLSNVFWLDGVYMLPLILWGIWRYVSEKKKGMFYVSIALSILFNWYTGYMNCLFAVFYFIYEQVLWNYEHGILTFKRTAGQFVRFCILELLGVLLSCTLFLPVVFGQSSGRGVLDSGIFSFGTNGSFLDIFRGFMIGTPNIGLPFKDDTITLFCGVFLLICGIAYFSYREIKPFHKICMAVLIGVMVLSEFIQPLEHIWCGFKFEDSFQFRFAYITIFTVIFAAARGMERFEHVGEKLFLKICGGCIAAALIFDLLRPFNSTALWIQNGLLIFYGLVIWFYFRKENLRKLCLMAVGLVFYAEILANGYWVASENYQKPAGAYEAYSAGQEKLTASIKNYDQAPFYRMEQNENRDRKPYDHSFFSNESLAYGYSGIQQYSSSYDKKTADFIHWSGYCKVEFPSLYHEPILTSDSLLGVKYLMSSKDYEGFEKIADFTECNGKSVYVNPYALGLGFGVAEQALENIEAGNQIEVATIAADNPFEFQNKMFSALLGEDMRVYTPVSAEAVYDEASEQMYFTLPSVDEESVVYGYTRSALDDIPMFINEKFSGNYWNIWGASGVYSVGASKDVRNPEVRRVRFDVKDIDAEVIREAVIAKRKLEAGAGSDTVNIPEPWIDSVFYKLNMDVFEQVIQRLRENEFQTEIFTDGFVTGNYTASEDGWLMLTIPNDGGWEISVNGETVSARDGINTFMTIPVKAGQNRVELTYHPKGIRTGIILSVVSVIIFAGWIFTERRKDRNR